MNKLISIDDSDLDLVAGGLSGSIGGSVGKDGVSVTGTIGEHSLTVGVNPFGLLNKVAGAVKGLLSGVVTVSGN